MGFNLGVNIPAVHNAVPTVILSMTDWADAVPVMVEYGITPIFASFSSTMVTILFSAPEEAALIALRYG